MVAAAAEVTQPVDLTLIIKYLSNHQCQCQWQLVERQSHVACSLLIAAQPARMQKAMSGERLGLICIKFKSSPSGSSIILGYGYYASVQSLSCSACSIHISHLPLF